MGVVFFLLAAMSLNGSPIDVTRSKLAWIETGGIITVEFGIGNYGRNNPGVSPYPTTVGLLAIGQIPKGLTAENVPGSSQPYLPGMYLQAYLESVDGSISIPFSDPNATGLGLAPGYLIALTGQFSAGGTAVPVATFQGSVSMSLDTAEALFGSNAGSYSGAAQIRLVNLGAPFVLGIGDPYTVGQSISEPGIRGLGRVQTAGMPGIVTIHNNPEPSTAALLVLPAALFWLVMKPRKT